MTFKNLFIHAVKEDCIKIASAVNLDLGIRWWLGRMIDHDTGKPLDLYCIQLMKGGVPQFIGPFTPKDMAIIGVFAFIVHGKEPVDSDWMLRMADSYTDFEEE